jgi:hypothetical protein
MPQWVVREYLARKGLAEFQPQQIETARCSLLGYAMKYMQVEGTNIPNFLLRVDEQPEVGISGYDKGSEILTSFFKKELEKFLVPDLVPKGRQIIECCLDNGTVHDYERLI